MSGPFTPRPGLAQRIADDRFQLPGMLPQEIAIFKTWFAINGNKYTAAQFNVRVGTGYDPGSQYVQVVRDSVLANSKKRIDSLLFAGIQPSIVEVKYRATPLVVGQILCYRLLYIREVASLPIPAMIVLCFQTDTDTMYCCSQLGIDLQVVPTDFTGVKVQKTG